MTNQMHDEIESPAPTEQTLEIGGLRFEVSFRKVGATLRVKGLVDGTWTEMLRFDDFVEDPHFHVPASAGQIDFDRVNGEPMAWYIEQVRDHLGELLEKGGFGDILASVDLSEISKNSDKIRKAMVDIVPEGFVRVPGYGLTRAE